MNGNMSSAILRELQVGDPSTSTAKDNIRWSRSIVLGERGQSAQGDSAPQLAKQALGWSLLQPHAVRGMGMQWARFDVS